MKDYPFFPLYLANFQRDIRGKTMEQIGEYIISLMDAWQDMDREAMPLWLQEAAQKAIDKSKTLSDNAKQRWEASKSNANALQKQCKSKANAMQKDGFAMQSRVEENIEDENTINTNARARDKKEAKELFEMFRLAYPGTKPGAQVAWGIFEKSVPKDDLLMVAQSLEGALSREKTHKAYLRSNNAFCPEWKNLKTWINQKCWEQEFGTEVFTKPMSRQDDREAALDAVYQLVGGREAVFGRKR